MRALVWFRNDLRVSDNTALHAAAQQVGRGGSVIGVFLISPSQWQEHDWAGVKVELIRRSLEVLSADLAALNIPLLLVHAPRFSDAPAAITKLAREHGCDLLHFNREYEINERRRDDAVVAACAKAGIRSQAHHDQVLLPPGEVRTGEGKFYTVFSPFKRAYYKLLEERGLGESDSRATGGVARVLPKPARQAPTGIAPSPIPSAIDGFTTTIPASRWPAGEHAARKRLQLFIDTAVGTYKSRRDHPAIDATSVLSPYLSIGCVSPRECLRAALNVTGGKLDSNAASLAGATHWISELIWREFYRHIIVGFPRVCMGKAFKPATDRIRWSDNEGHFQAWCEGRTGVLIVDAGMRQLLATGWMHNRVRMIVAMYLTKDLFIDWRKGERHFMRHLVDGDLAQNNGGWQWSASTGTDAAPYFRIFNPITQSRKFDAEGTYIRTYVPELADLEGGEDGEGEGGAIHDPSDLPVLLRTGLDYPEPLVDRASVKDRVLQAFQSLGERGVKSDLFLS